MSLNRSLLENVKTANGKTTARCPACKESGCDEGGDHLVIYPDGRYGCAVNPGDKVHTKRIFELVGANNEPSAQHPGRKSGMVYSTIEAATSAARRFVEKKTEESWKWIRTDVYRSATGEPVAAVLRFDRADGATEDNGKPIKTYRPVHVVDGGWQLGDPPGLLPLFNLPAIVNSDGIIHINEGEKAAMAGTALGLTSTTSMHGAKSAAKTDYAPLKDRDVVIHPDNDRKGREYAEDVAARAYAAGAASVKIVVLPGLPPKGDMADYVAARTGMGMESVRAEVVAVADATEVWSPAKAAAAGVKPTIVLPGGPRTITAAGEDLGRLLASTQKVFIRGGALVTLDADGDGHPILRQLKPVALASVFESVATLAKMTQGSLQPAICTESAANLIGSSAAFRDQMPSIRIITRCPVLIERNGKLLQITGYDLASGIMAGGCPVPDMTLTEAKERLYELLRDFRFATPADRARALAALITPAMVFGGLLKGRPPIDLGEADDSQAGKGFRNKIKSRVYGETMRCIAQKRDGGVGSLEESFNAALIQGAVFICLENVRGKIDSPAIESFITEDHYTARCAYHENVDIDPRRVCLSMTSNKADLTTDLANRCACVRILKQPQGYAYARYPEGDILDHVAAYQGRYLGAVFAVIRAWHAAGCSRTDECRHDFRAWAQTMDWIVQNLMDAGPLLDGHRETQRRMTNPSMNWLRDVALAVVRAQRTDEGLRAGHLVDLLAEAGVDVPGLPEGGDPSEPNNRKSAQQAVGRKLWQCFRNEDVVAIDSFTIRRQTTYNQQHRSETNEYWFSAAGNGDGDGPIVAGPPDLTKETAPVLLVSLGLRPPDANCG